MPPKRVYLIPGFGASDLGDLATGEQLWWDINVSPGNGLGKMKLAPNGVDPDPVIGAQMGVNTVPQAPWGTILQFLQLQLDPASWAPEVTVYDWRLDPMRTARQLAANVVARNSPALPATLVGHSLGGIIAGLAWAELAAQGKTDYVRRIITVGSPWQGSYLPVLWLTGAYGMVQELTAIYGLVSVLPGINPLVWELSFLNALALSWPGFYALFPFAAGAEARNDPNRQLLFNAANYPPAIAPSQTWLSWSKDTFQPAATAAVDSIPPWILTTVAGVGVGTPGQLRSSAVPLRLTELPDPFDGDGIVTTPSALRAISAQVTVPSSHASETLGMSLSGKIVELILDNRGPPSPPPPLDPIPEPIPYLVTDPPQSDPQNPIVCIGGG